MTELITNYFITYGYLAIFCIVLLQEMGMPGIPNELVLIYFGYLGHRSGLSCTIIICLAIIADMIGSLFLYLLFYYGKNLLARVKPRWLRLPTQRISSLREKIISKNGRNIFIAKLTPFVRSYLPVVAGLLQVQHQVYGRIVFCAAIVWNGSLITAGWLLYF
ncbi:MAG: VTT domain-containing protein [Sediminibacterium sp.]